MSRFGKRLDGLEPAFPERSGGPSLTAGMTPAECAAAYARLLRGETLQEVFPGAEIEPDPEPDLVECACDGLSASELSALYVTVLHARGREAGDAILRQQITRNRSRGP